MKTKSRRLSQVLYRDRANQYCADCTIRLSDSNEIYASFLPLSFHIDERWTRKNWIETKYGRNFEEMHESFTPPNSHQIPSTQIDSVTTRVKLGFFASCRNDRTSLQSIAHGVFICKDCAEFHSRLNSSITTVKLVSDASCWSEEEYREMKNRGNTHGNNLLEKFMPDEWTARKESQFSKKLERETFIRYKYEILDFLLPKERWSYKKFMIKSQTATKKWKLLAARIDRDVDWGVYTLGYRDYKVVKTPSSYSTLTKKKKKYEVPLQLVQEAGGYLQDARRRQLSLISSVIKVQAFFRMISTRRQVLHYSSKHNFVEVLRFTVRIQSHTRSFIMAQKFYNKKIVTIKIQTLFRGRRARLLYLLTRELIIKIQAFVRGAWGRHNVHTVMNSWSTDYKRQIATLWGRTNTPLAYRTEFWLYTHRPGFVSFALQQNELGRLWELLEFDYKDDNSRLNKFGDSLLSSIIYVRHLYVKAFLQRPSYKFPAELNFKSKGYKVLNYYANRLQLERVQVYERLLRLKDVDQVYQISGISADERYKKARLAKSIWYETENAPNPEISSYAIENTMEPVMSSIVFDQLFPELRYSGRIDPIMPSKKSLDRIGVQRYETNNVPVPLSLEGTSMHFKSNLDQQMIRNLSEVSVCFVTGIHHLALSQASTNYDDMISKRRHLKTIESSKYSLIHRFVNTSNTNKKPECNW